jgi:hypothetical protein
VDPAPAGGVELEGVGAGDHVEAVVEQGHQTVDDMEDPDQDHHDRGEDDEPGGRATGLPICG